MDYSSLRALCPVLCSCFIVRWVSYLWFFFLCSVRWLCFHPCRVSTFFCLSMPHSPSSAVVSFMPRTSVISQVSFVHFLSRSRFCFCSSLVKFNLVRSMLCVVVLFLIKLFSAWSDFCVAVSVLFYPVLLLCPGVHLAPAFCESLTYTQYFQHISASRLSTSLVKWVHVFPWLFSPSFSLIQFVFCMSAKHKTDSWLIWARSGGVPPRQSLWSSVSWKKTLQRVDRIQTISLYTGLSLIRLINSLGFHRLSACLSPCLFITLHTCSFLCSGICFEYFLFALGLELSI